MASQNGHLDIVKVLIEADGDVNQANNDEQQHLEMLVNMDILKLFVFFFNNQTLM